MRYPSWDEMVAEVLHRARTRAGFSQFELAYRIGVGERLIRRYEQARNQDGKRFKHGHKGRIVDEWLDVCGWEAEVIAGPVNEWMRRTA